MIKNSDINWNKITSKDFWKIADQIQDKTLESAKKLFSQLETATPEELRKLLIQYRYFTIYYIPDLALLITRMDNGSLRSFLAEILNDELGNGKPEHAHPQLYDDFLISIGVKTETLNNTALKNNVSLLNEARRRLVDVNFSIEYAIGLRAMGGECVCQIYITQLYESLMKNPYILKNRANIDWFFWDLHVGEHDIEHREQTRSLINTAIVNSEGTGVQELGEGYGYSMESWQKFWINIFEAPETEEKHLLNQYTSITPGANVQLHQNIRNYPPNGALHLN